MPGHAWTLDFLLMFHAPQKTYIPQMAGALESLEDKFPMLGSCDLQKSA